MKLRIFFTALVACVLLGACDNGNDTAEDEPTPEAAPAAPPGGAAAEPDTTGTAQQQFWSQLQSLCGNAYEGRVVEAPAGDTTFANKRLVMHVRACTESEVRVPFHVGENRSRTWVLTKTDAGLRLKHDHRHADGVPDSVTQYGGDTADMGSPQRQEFRADTHTAQLIPAASTNVWTVEIVPGETYTYALRREGTDRRFRIDFDLRSTVAAPPPPWGADR